MATISKTGFDAYSTVKRCWCFAKVQELLMPTKSISFAFLMLVFQSNLV
jgi:hypothetical protein